MKKWVNGEVMDLSATDTVQKTVDQVSAVDKAREVRRGLLRAEASAGIRAVLGTTKTGEDLLIHQQNIATYAQQIARAEAKGTATVAEIAELDALDAARDVIQQWRDAENAASTLLDAAGLTVTDTPAERIAEINAVTATWPS